MAHSPEKKAKAVADLVLGMSQPEVAKKHRIPVRTVGEWSQEIANNRQTNAPARRDAFESAFYTLIESMTQAFIVFAKTCNDETFVREKPEGAARLAERTTDFIDRVMARAGAQTQAPTNHPD